MPLRWSRALTALVFLIRAGGDPADAATWPITWELRSSDNGPLFQFMQDVVAGRALDWSFSPQVFVFPELPLSAVAFAVSGRRRVPLLPRRRGAQ